jgi:hypothetical protein
MVRAESALAAALVVVIVSLLLVGVVSHTPLRHAVQVAPVIAVLGLAIARVGWARFAATAVLLFWLGIMALIWLYLAGIARIASGHFTGVEVALTVVIGFASAAGIVAVFRASDSSRWPARLAAFATAAALQVGAMWLSLQPMFATR